MIAAAETAAAEIVAEAQSEADRILGAARAEAEQIRAAARAESEQTVTAANREATGRVEQARGAVEGLIAQADKLRAQVGALGRDLASNVPGSGVSAAAAASRADRLSRPVAGAGPAGRGSAGPARGRAAGRARGRARADPQAGAGRAAEQRGSDLAAPRVDGFDRRDGSTRGGGADRAARGASGSDLGAARLVAMNMALDGASRAQITARITAEFSAVGNVEILVDDVIRRAAR